MTRPSGPMLVVRVEDGPMKQRSVSSKTRLQPVARRLVRAEEPEVAAAVGPGRGGVQVAHELARRSGCSRPWRRRARRPRPRTASSVGHRQLLAQPAAVGVRRRGHPPVALGGQRSQLGDQAAGGVEQRRRVGTTAATPRASAGARGCSASPDSGTWCARLVPSTWTPSTTCGAGPALRGAQDDRRPLVADRRARAVAASWPRPGSTRIASCGAAQRGAAAPGRPARGSSPATVTGSQPWLRR